ncbi:MAG: calcium-binding protein [Planctomycetes bacterium]|nr:calcium-binding protein [Planctomycetota bacterium]
MPLNHRNASAGGREVFPSGWATLVLAAGLFTLAGPRCVVIGGPPGPLVTVMATPTSGTDSVAVTLTATATGGTEPYTYAWTASPDTTITGADSANATATVTQTTTFTCTVTDAEGKTDTAIAPVTVTTAISVTISGKTTAFGGGAVPLTALVTNQSGEVTFMWLQIGVGTAGSATLTNATSQIATATFSADAYGDFTFRVTAADTRGSDTDTITITAYPGGTCCFGTFTMGTDDFSGTPGDDIFDGALYYNIFIDTWVNTVNDSDQADGLDGDDEADIEFEEGTTVNPTLANIETLSIAVRDWYNLDSGEVTFDASKTTGMTTLNATDCSDTLNVVNLAAIPNVSMTNSGQGLTLSFADTAVSGSSDTLDLTLSSMSGGTFTAPATIENVSIVSGGSGANVLTGLVFTPSTGTTTVAVAVTGANDLSLGTVTNGSPIDASVFTGNLLLVLAQAAVVTGGSGDDTIVGSDAADSISGGDGADIITGGSGDDGLAGGADADTFVLAQTATDNGDDTISDFTASDVLNFSAFATGDAPAGTVEDTSTGDQAVAGNDIWIVTDADGSLDTAAEVAALFGGGGKPFAAGVADMHMALLIQDSQSGGSTTIWFIADADSNTTVAEGECVRVATLSAFNGAIGDVNIAD